MTGKSTAASKKNESKLAVKKTAGKGKATKDPNMPKRPAGPFFIFMEDFRKQFKEENPKNNSVAAVGKAGGAKWKSLTAAEKAPFEATAAKRKKQYEKDMDAYNKKPAAASKNEDIDEGEESDKSKSEVNNEEEDDESEEEEDDD